MFGLLGVNIRLFFSLNMEIEMERFNHKKPTSLSISYFGLSDSKVPPALLMEGNHCFRA